MNHDPESWARLQGVMAMLALPPVRARDGRERRRVVEIEIAPDQWAVVDGISIESGRLTFYRGTNGHRSEFRFSSAEPSPRWRIDHAIERKFVEAFG